MDRQETFEGASTWASHPFHNLALFVPPAIACFLGVWQLQRYEEKQEQLARRQERISSSPVNAHQLDLSADNEFARVKLEGETFGKPVYIGPRPRNIDGETKAGYLMVQAIRGKDNKFTALLNRGWVPQGWNEGGSQHVCVKTEGVVRSSEKPSVFVPKNRDDQWIWVDVPALNRKLNLAPNTMYVEATTPSLTKETGFPMVRLPFLLAHWLRNELSSYTSFSVMPRDHINYSLTWFALAACTALLARRAVRQNQRSVLSRR